MARSDSRSVRFLCFVVIAAVLRCLAGSFASASGNGGRPPDALSLQIVVLRGEDGVNIIKNKTAVMPVVEVRDKNKLPGVGVVGAGIVGAVVYFELADDSHAQFHTGSQYARSLSVVTDTSGRAAAPDMALRGKGLFNIRIRATYQGQTVTRTITQENFKTIAAAHKAGRIPGSSHGDPETQTASQSGTESAGQAADPAGSSAPSTVASTASSAGVATGASHTALLLGGLAAAGAAAGGVAYYASSKSNGPSCNANSLANQVSNDLANEANVCSSAGATFSQCQSAAQTALNDLGQLCSCAGTGYGQQFAQELQTLINDYNLGLNLPSSCQ
jgi:hypothetical protein